MTNQVIVMGDLHGVWSQANHLINQKKPQIVLQCGDFGYWPKWDNTTTIVVEDNFDGQKLKPFNQYGIKPEDARIYWCDGNHEDHESLKKIRDAGIFEIQPNVFYQPRGSTLELPDGRVVLFMGGADSVDKRERTPGRDWFPEETIKSKDLDNLPNYAVDIIISHTAPKEFYKKLMTTRNLETYNWEDKFNDPSREALSYILHKYKPSLWYFAHFHIFGRGYYENTRWCCLNMAGHSNWWTKLD
jgi:hypothetical protein